MEPYTGTAQGVRQALFALFFMAVGVASDASVDFVRGAALKIALVIFPGAMIACGIVVDRRRIGRPLRFVAPRGARLLLGLVALALPLVPTAVSGCWSAAAPRRSTSSTSSCA